MKLVKYPTQSLLEKSVDVDLNDKKTTVFLMDFLGFFLTLRDRAIGLSAPQVGHNIRAFISMGDLFINPVIVEKSKGTYEVFEGCLSLEEGKTYKVRRHKDIVMEWLDPKGDKRREKLEGFPAQVAQHEFDHLEGILLV